MLHDPDFLSSHRIKLTPNQSHQEYYWPQSSEVCVASKVQAKNKRSSSCLQQEIKMSCLLCTGTTTEASSSRDTWIGEKDGTLNLFFILILLFKIDTLYYCGVPCGVHVHGHVPLSCVLSRRCLGRILKKWPCFSQLKASYVHVSNFLNGCHDMEFYRSLSHVLSLGKCWKWVGRDTQQLRIWVLTLKISFHLLVWAA